TKVSTSMKKARGFTRKGALPAVFGALALIALFAVGSSAQDDKKDKDKKAPEEPSPIVPGLVKDFFGSARMGYPNDRPTKDQKAGEGKVRFTAFGETNPIQVKSFPIMGATVYYCVYENLGITGDTFGTGLSGFDLLFHNASNYADESPSYMM